MLGLVSVDILLDGMRNQVRDAAEKPGRKLMVVTPDGLLAIHPDPDVALLKTMRDYIDNSGRADLEPVAEAARLRQHLFFQHQDARTGEHFFTAVEPVGGTGGSLVLTEANDHILNRWTGVLALVCGGGLLAALASTLAIQSLTRRISRPVENLASSARRLSQGDYEAPVPHGERSDEVGYLARTLDGARSSIKRQLAEIAEMSAAQQKLASELSIARHIQMSMVPPPRCIAHESGLILDVHAMLVPSKAVGGDFYGYHVSEDMFFFGIGDVSDKGIPAALFMARSDAILITALNGMDSPSRTLAFAAPLLCEGNDACMFVTALIGSIDLRTGECLMARAGHDTPLLLRADGHIERLEFGGGPALGIDISDDFPLWRGRLRPGDSLIAWTDGVTEAFNRADEAFGDEERLTGALRPELSARENCERLITSVHAFADGAPQSDDIAVLALSMQGTIAQEPAP